MTRHGFGHWRDVLMDGSLGLLPVLRSELGLTPGALQSKAAADQVTPPPPPLFTSPNTLIDCVPVPEASLVWLPVLRSVLGVSPRAPSWRVGKSESQSPK